MVDGVEEAAQIPVALAEGAAEQVDVPQRRWSDSMAAAIAIGYTQIDPEVVELEGGRFAKATVRTADTEISIE